MEIQIISILIVLILILLLAAMGKKILCKIASQSTLPDNARILFQTKIPLKIRTLIIVLALIVLGLILGNAIIGYSSLRMGILYSCVWGVILGFVGGILCFLTMPIDSKAKKL